MPKTKRRRHLVIVVVVALVAIAAAGSAWLTDRDGSRPTSAAATGQGDPDSTGSKCGPVLRTSAAGTGEHIDNAPIAYPAPPSFGDHRSRWEVRAASFASRRSPTAMPACVAFEIPPLRSSRRRGPPTTEAPSRLA